MKETHAHTQTHRRKAEENFFICLLPRKNCSKVFIFVVHHFSYVFEVTFTEESSKHFSLAKAVSHDLWWMYQESLNFTLVIVDAFCPKQRVCKLWCTFGEWINSEVDADAFAYLKQVWRRENSYSVDCNVQCGGIPRLILFRKGQMENSSHLNQMKVDTLRIVHRNKLGLNYLRYWWEKR